MVDPMRVRCGLASWLFALVNAALLIACGGGNGTTTTETVTAALADGTTTDTASETTTEEVDEYPQKARDNYLASCEATSGGDTATCECVLEELERTGSFEEFVKIDADLRAGGATPRAVTDRLAACLERSSP
jgi:hypothetical protein